MPSKKQKSKTIPKGRPGSKSGAHVRHNVAVPPSPAQGKPNVPSKLQQDVLDTFAQAFPKKDPDVLRETIQTVKGALFAREFQQAFEGQERQQAYCLRWSPSRALAYLDLIHSLHPVRRFLGLQDIETARGDDPVDRVTNKVILCFGAGPGAEVVSFAAAVADLARISDPSDDSAGSSADSKPTLRLNVVDIADWSGVISSLADSMITTLFSAASPDQEASVGLPFALDFKNASVLGIRAESLVQMLSGASKQDSEASETPAQALITLFFTLNELYSSSMPQTAGFLFQLSTVVRPKTLLLVVDSPGSYSTVKVGSKETTYPMHFAIDHFLLEVMNAKDETHWRKLDSEESRWWRMNRSELKYNVPGVELEDMRMQWHLYEKC